MIFFNIVPGGDDDILEDRDLNQIVNEEDQNKVVNNDPETSGTDKDRTVTTDNKKDEKSSRPT